MSARSGPNSRGRRDSFGRPAGRAVGSRRSRRWLSEHRRDPYVQRARDEGFRSRAAYKLLEVDQRDRILSPGATVVDLGAAPGGWSQVARQRVGAQGRVFALDILEMEPLPGVTFVRGDFTEPEPEAALDECLGGRPVDVVLSDMAPNLSGVAAMDAARSSALAELALAFAQARLAPGGTLLMKVFQGEGFDALRRSMLESFEGVRVRKPDASRARSPEMYLLGRRAPSGSASSFTGMIQGSNRAR